MKYFCSSKTFVLLFFALAGSVCGAAGDDLHPNISTLDLKSNPDDISALEGCDKNTSIAQLFHICVEEIRKAKTEGGVSRSSLYWSAFLYQAVKVCDVRAFMGCLKANVDNGGSLLHVAVKEGCNELVLAIVNSKLLSNILRALLEAKDGDGNTPLHLVAGQGLNEVVKEILSCAKEFPDGILLAENDSNYTPLHCAVNNDSCEVAKTILVYAKECGLLLDILVKTAKSTTPLHLAAQKNSYKVAEEILLHAEKEFRVLKRVLLAKSSQADDTPLHYSVYYDSVEVTERILSYAKKIHRLERVLSAKNINKKVPKDLAKSDFVGKFDEIVGKLDAISASVVLPASSEEKVKQDGVKYLTKKRYGKKASVEFSNYLCTFKQDQEDGPFTMVCSDVNFKEGAGGKPKGSVWPTFAGLNPVILNNDIVIGEGVVRGDSTHSTADVRNSLIEDSVLRPVNSGPGKLELHSNDSQKIDDSLGCVIEELKTECPVPVKIESQSDCAQKTDCADKIGVKYCKNEHSVSEPVRVAAQGNGKPKTADAKKPIGIEYQGSHPAEKQEPGDRGHTEDYWYPGNNKHTEDSGYIGDGGSDSREVSPSSEKYEFRDSQNPGNYLFTGIIATGLVICGVALFKSREKIRRKFITWLRRNRKANKVTHKKISELKISELKESGKSKIVAI